VPQASARKRQSPKAQRATEGRFRFGEEFDANISASLLPGGFDEEVTRAYIYPQFDFIADQSA
jgi:hypothetical protein